MKNQFEELFMSTIQHSNGKTNFTEKTGEEFRNKFISTVQERNNLADLGTNPIESLDNS